jgi:hypothetical protein
MSGQVMYLAVFTGTVSSRQEIARRPLSEWPSNSARSFAILRKSCIEASNTATSTLWSGPSVYVERRPLTDRCGRRSASI